MTPQENVGIVHHNYESSSGNNSEKNPSVSCTTSNIRRSIRNTRTEKDGEETRKQVSSVVSRNKGRNESRAESRH